MRGSFLLFSREGKTPKAVLGVLLYSHGFYLGGLFFLDRGFGEGAFNPSGGCSIIKGTLF
jgi:hypothetical protein